MEGWGVEVNAYVELGHVAFDRSLSGRAPSLFFLIGLLWSGVILEGKDGSGPRISDWGGANLSDAQLKYAAIDAYATMMVYLRLKQMMTPREEVRYYV